MRADPGGRARPGKNAPEGDAPAAARMYNAGWDDRPAEYAELRDCWLTRRRMSRVAKYLSAAEPGDRVLDVGCGVGEVLIDLAAARPDLSFVGVEPQGSYTAFATGVATERGLTNVSFRVGLAERLAGALAGEAPFDWIFSNDVLHHVADERLVARSVAEVARPEAAWLAIEPNWFNPYVFLECALKRGERNFRPDRFLLQARESGWVLEDRSYIFLIPSSIKHPPPVLIRLENRLEENRLLAGGITLTLVRGMERWPRASRYGTDR
jgi:2-polyprenyl-3-methyl-5-hydroxy-6-metoxy-1,4-benzoquinol methylase